MSPSVLFILASDPRADGRVAEALRIAAGIGAWQRARVTLYLRGAAVLVVAESTEELVDPDSYGRHLQILSERGLRIYAQPATRWQAQIESGAWKPEALGDAELAELAAECDYLLRF